MAIREMLPQDLPIALSVINEEGWGYTPPEIDRMLRLEPGGSFLYVTKEPVGAITTVVHGSIGVIGHLVVSRKVRGRGIGKALLEHAIEYLHARGTDSVVVIATDEGRPLYLKHGFKVEREVLCKHFMVDATYARMPRSKPTPMRKSDIRAVSEMDRELFGEDRSRLMNMLFDEGPEACYKLVSSQGLAGYSMGRRTATGFDFGPWVCKPEAFADAEQLLNATLSAAGQGKIYSGLFSENKAAVAIIDKLPLIKMWSTQLMVLGKSRCYKIVDQIFGIAAFELG